MRSLLVLVAPLVVGCVAPRITHPEVEVPMLEGHFQNAYVTRDLEKSIAVLGATYGVESVLRFHPTLEVNTPRGRRTMKLEVGIAWVGDYQIELIQPVDGDVDMYREELPDRDDGSMRFHHTGMRVDDFDAVRAQLARDQRTIAFETEQPGIRVVYVDARDTVGHYLEYVWFSPEAWGAMGGR